MALYQILPNTASVLRESDGAFIAPDDPVYVAWLAAGNTPDPVDQALAAAITAQQTETSGQNTLASDLKALAVFQALKTATPAQITTYVTNNFGNFTAQQQATVKMLIQVAALVVRRL